jgi:hypothetical protein
MENTTSRSKGADKWPPHRVDDVIVYASEEQWDRVGSALDAGFPANATGTKVADDSLLHWAVYYRCMPMLRRLLALGAHVDVRGSFQRTPAHYAAVFDRLDALVTLVEAGADVNARDSFLETPLHAAAKYSLPCTRYLLTLPQVDLSATDENGYTAEYAVRKFGKSAAADAVRAVVRATSWRCGVMSDLGSLATALVRCRPRPGRERPLITTPYSLYCVVVLAWFAAAAVGPQRPLEPPSCGVGAGSGGWWRPRARSYCRPSAGGRQKRARRGPQWLAG